MTLSCYHCGLPVNSLEEFNYQILGENRVFCCAGCLAIAETLDENGLTDFYRFRAEKSSKPEQLIPQEILDLEALDSPEILNEISNETDEDNKFSRTIELGIEGITCAACGWLIEKHLSAIPQVQKISVNVSTHRAQLIWKTDYPLSDILKTLSNLGYRAYPFSESAREQSFEQANRTYIKRLLVAALGMMQVMTYALAIYIGEFKDLESNHQTFLYWISGFIATPVVFYSARPFFASAYRNLKAKQLGMNLPVSIAILAAYTSSVYSLFFDGNVYYFDSVVMFTFFLLIGRFLEHRARYRSLLKQQNFQQLLPLSVNIKDSNGKITSVPIAKVKKDDVIIINAGGVIPVDGILLENSAEIDEAILTGEFLPVRKTPGDPLISGSSNHSASLLMQVSQNSANSHLKQLISLQQDAEQMKPDSVSLADKIAHWYVLILLILVCASGWYWWQVEPESVFPIILSVLVVSCPCALSLATPAAIAAATSQLSDLGLMIRSKEALSNLAKITDIYFDKTGTLTTGSMQIKSVISHSNMSEEQCLNIAGSLEKISDHPISYAFSQHQNSAMKVSNLQESIGLGVSGTINETSFYLGSKIFVTKESLELNAIDRQAFEIVLYLTTNSQHLCTFVLQDQIKKSSLETIEMLLKDKYTIQLISGDDETSVSNVAKMLNIDNFHSKTSPEDKLSLITQAHETGKNTLMIGDGFNDVGALAASTVSITMDSGTNLSKTASDAVLVASDLKVIPQSLAIAKKVRRIVKQNLGWAIFYNLTAIPFAMMGLVPAWLAALGMSFSSLVVVLNALRLRK